MKDLFPHHNPRSVAGLNFEAAIKNAELHAAKHEAVHGRAPRTIADEQKARRDFEATHAKLRALPRIADMRSPLAQDLKSRLINRLAKLAKTCHYYTKTYGTAALVAGCVTLAGFLAKEPTNHALSLPKAPHEAAPSTTPPDATDDGWRGLPFWA